MQLPVFNLIIDENNESELEVNYMALVDKPAIEKNFLAFNQIKPLQFSFDEEKRIIFGPAMLADFPIYRNNKEYGEHYVVFSKDLIFSIVKKFFAKGYGQNFNLSHDPNQRTEGVSIFQSFITNSELGIKPMAGYEDAADGSWFIAANVKNENVWQDVKSGKFKGFSVEGTFLYKSNQQMSAAQRIYEDLKKILGG